MRLLALLAVGVFVGALASAPVPKQKPKDEDAIVGTWRAEGWDYGDPKASQPWGKDLTKLTLTFEAGEKSAMVYPSGHKDEGKYKLDPASDPKALDLDEGGRPVKLAVYELDGDTLRIAMPDIQGAKRPAAVKADGQGTVLFTFKRVKDEPKKDK